MPVCCKLSVADGSSVSRVRHGGHTPNIREDLLAATVRKQPQTIQQQAPARLPLPLNFLCQRRLPHYSHARCQTLPFLDLLATGSLVTLGILMSTTRWSRCAA